MFIYSAAYCTNNEICKWGEQPVSFPTTGTLPKWASLFSSSHERYPRLDPLSKGIALLTETVLNGPPATEQLGVVLSTVNGCSDVDHDFYQSAVTSPELASPKLFPYTLPSAGLAEVMIRYGITGPSLVMWQSEVLLPMVNQLKRWILNQEIASGLLIGCDADFSGSEGKGLTGFVLHIGPEEKGPRFPELTQQTTHDVLRTLQLGKHETLSL